MSAECEHAEWEFVPIRSDLPLRPLHRCVGCGLFITAETGVRHHGYTPKAARERVVYWPRDLVTINALENGAGVVNAVLIGTTSVQYEVRWWHNGEAKTAWLNDGELSRRTS